MDYNNNNGYNNYYNNDNNNNGQCGMYGAQDPTNTYQYAYNPSMQVPPKKNGNGAAITSMIFGIISIVCCCCCGMGFFCGAVAIIFAIISGKKKGRIEGMAIAGLVCGIIGAVLGFGCDLCFWVFGGGLEAFWEGFMEGFNESYYGY